MMQKSKKNQKNIVKREISLDDYKQRLFSGEEHMRNMNIIGSNKHDIYSMKMNKIALSANDNKRIVMRDKTHTKALRIKQ